ncbi:hypothetical protein HDU98_001292 [Podochytrium sp. JEL0797]|nr:hypothetical protein HDU98_001292 [Podochytrium sp. JEL0797]
MSVAKKEWTCPQCTFINSKPLAPICEICESPREPTTTTVVSSTAPTPLEPDAPNPPSHKPIPQSTNHSRAQLNQERLARIAQKHSAEDPREAVTQLPKRQKLTPDPTPAPHPPSSFLNGRRIYWNPACPVDCFITDHCPTNTTIFDAEWIQVESPRHPQPLPLPTDPATQSRYNTILSQIANKIAAGQKISKAEKHTAQKQILETARTRSDTCGKWMLFPSAEEVNDTWSKICRATAAGALGCSAKVATTDPNSPHGPRYLICVYCPDVFDEAYLERVLRELKGMGFVVTSAFKPDVFTALGIDGKNPWRIPPTVHGEIWKAVFPGAAATG